VGTEKPSYKGFRFPAEIISHCVGLYHRFPLSLREVEEMMLQRGVTVSHESIRQWCATFGQTYANGLRRRRARPGDKWHLDEVALSGCWLVRVSEAVLGQGGVAVARWSGGCWGQSGDLVPGGESSGHLALPPERRIEQLAVGLVRVRSALVLPRYARAQIAREIIQEVDHYQAEAVARSLLLTR
jgi:hypothetical protein